MAASFPEIVPAALTGGDATYYTVTPGKKAIRIKIWLCNTSASPVAVTLNAVPSSGSSSVANQIFAETLAAKEAAEVDISPNLAAGGNINGLAATAAVVSIRIAPAEV